MVLMVLLLFSQIAISRRIAIPESKVEILYLLNFAVSKGAGS